MNPVAVIDNGQPGYAETGSWSTAVGGFDGTNRVAATTRGKVATATASWTFSGLPVHNYQVWVTYVGKSSYATNAPFAVYNGGTNLGTTLLNESILVTQSQGGLDQGSYGGVGWLELGVNNITSGQLEVLLSNRASGNHVDADAVMIVPEGGPADVGRERDRAGHDGGRDRHDERGRDAVRADVSAPAPAAPALTVSIGAAAAVAVNVVYNQGAESSPSQPAGLLVDAALSELDGAFGSNGSKKSGS